MFDATEWYWLADDGRLFSSADASLVSPDDDRFVEWKSGGRVPTPWPNDAEDEQTFDSLRDVVSPYGLIVAEDAVGAAQRKQLDALTGACAAAITGGYTSEALGSVHVYPSNQVDQLNMMGSVTDALTPERPEGWKTPFWCANVDGLWEFRDHSDTQIIAAGQAGKAHVVACQTTLARLSAKVLLATTVEAIEAVTWPEVSR
ncbi:hypothetical protein ACIQT7_18155 [Agrobacterium deltaense]